MAERGNTVRFGKIVIIYVHPNPKVQNKRRVITRTCTSDCSDYQFQDRAVNIGLGEWLGALPVQINGSYINPWEYGTNRSFPCSGGTVVILYDYISRVYNARTQGAFKPKEIGGGSTFPSDSYQMSFGGQMSVSKTTGRYTGDSVDVKYRGNLGVSGIALDKYSYDLSKYAPYLRISIDTKSIIMIGQQQQVGTPVQQTRKHQIRTDWVEDGTDEYGEPKYKAVPVYEDYVLSGPGVSFGYVVSNISIVNEIRTLPPPGPPEYGTVNITTWKDGDYISNARIFNLGLVKDIGYTRVSDCVPAPSKVQYHAIIKRNNMWLTGIGMVNAIPRKEVDCSIELSEVMFGDVHITSVVPVNAVDSAGNYISNAFATTDTPVNLAFFPKSGLDKAITVKDIGVIIIMFFGSADVSDCILYGLTASNAVIDGKSADFRNFGSVHKVNPSTGKLDPILDALITNVRVGGSGHLDLAELKNTKYNVTTSYLSPTECIAEFNFISEEELGEIEPEGVGEPVSKDIPNDNNDDRTNNVINKPGPIIPGVDCHQTYDESFYEELLPLPIPPGPPGPPGDDDDEEIPESFAYEIKSQAVVLEHSTFKLYSISTGAASGLTNDIITIGFTPNTKQEGNLIHTAKMPPLGVLCLLPDGQSVGSGGAVVDGRSFSFRAGKVPSGSRYILMGMQTTDTPDNKGTLEITISPSVAAEINIYDGDEYISTSSGPMSVSKLDAGTYRIDVSHDKYEQKSISATVLGGEITRVTVYLVPKRSVFTRFHIYFNVRGSQISMNKSVTYTAMSSPVTMSKQILYPEAILFEANCDVGDFQYYGMKTVSVDLNSPSDIDVHIFQHPYLVSQVTEEDT